jgi:hypothetical protein
MVEWRDDYGTDIGQSRKETLKNQYGYLSLTP